MSCVAVVFLPARKEKLAGQRLRELGASQDDWVGLREIFLGSDYAPIIQLSLRHVQDIQAALKHLEALRNLKMLDLGGTAIVDSDLGRLKDLTSLTSLDLSNTRVTDAGLEHLQNLRNLRHLRLDNTQVTHAGVKRLRQELPHVEVTIESRTERERKRGHH